MDAQRNEDALQEARVAAGGSMRHTLAAEEVAALPNPEDMVHSPVVVDDPLHGQGVEEAQGAYDLGVAYAEREVVHTFAALGAASVAVAEGRGGVGVALFPALDTVAEAAPAALEERAVRTLDMVPEEDCKEQAPEEGQKVPSTSSQFRERHRQSGLY